jgi:hypothetical protein
MARRPVDDDDFPPELWYFHLSGFHCRHEWLCAAMRFARDHGFNALAVNKLMINRRPLGTELAMELSPGMSSAGAAVASAANVWAAALGPWISPHRCRRCAPRCAINVGG